MTFSSNKISSYRILIIRQLSQEYLYTMSLITTLNTRKQSQLVYSNILLDFHHLFPILISFPSTVRIIPSLHDFIMFTFPTQNCSNCHLFQVSRFDILYPLFFTKQHLFSFYWRNFAYFLKEYYFSTTDAASWASCQGFPAAMAVQ